MAEEKNASQGAGTNWLVGVDKITTPTFEFIGFRIRDKLRTWLSQKARERVVLRRLEQEVLYRQVDLVNYGCDQFIASLDVSLELMLARHFETITPLIAAAVSAHQLKPERALECLAAGHTSKWADTSALNLGELVLYTLGASVLDLAISFYCVRLMCHYTQVPAMVQLNDPEITDEDVDEVMQDEKTFETVAEAVKVTEADMEGVTNRFTNAIAHAYGLKWNAELKTLEPKDPT
jgi:hypothetical protein